MANVLSTFNGYGAIWVALDRLGVKVKWRLSSEIDKYAIAVNDKNYPDTLQLGDVSKIDASKLGKLDLVVGGSPCQGFSFSGKGLAFDDPRSILFFEFVRIVKEARKVNPELEFLLENVKMKKEHIKTITEILEVEPFEINSGLVSAQNRKRLYWTNIPFYEQPKDKVLVMDDILERDVSDKFLIEGNWKKWLDNKGDERLKKKYSTLDSDKAITMTARQYANWNGNFVTVDPLERVNSMVKEFNVNPFGKGMNGNAYAINGKSPTLTTNKGEGSKISFKGSYFRKLTPVECERLQTLPDHYTAGVSNAQRYKMLGNGWNVDTIVHILKNSKLVK